MSPRNPNALLDISDLQTWFPVREGILQKITRYVRAVDGVDLTILPGQTLALVGESGCGKTTVGRTILRLETPHAGDIWYAGENILQLPPKDFLRFRRKIQVIMQDPGSALDPRMTVRDSIAEGMEAFGIGQNDEERTLLVEELMSQVALDPDTMWRFPHEFSGGQRQRICIARALAVKPELIICDESVSALDVSIQAQILNLLNDLQDKHELTYLFITHDLSVVRYFADNVAVMYLGRIVETGTTDRVFSEPRHPYTKALLSSIPSLDPENRNVKSVALGDVASPENPPPGCPYHPRCAERLPICSEVVPRDVKFSDGSSRCHLSQNND